MKPPLPPPPYHEPPRRLAAALAAALGAALPAARLAAPPALLVLATTLSGLSLFSCVGRCCFPQVTIQLADGGQVLPVVQEALAMVSFLATDLATANLTLTIDTFSPANVFGFNVHGYCRTRGAARACYAANLDVVSCWVHDVGAQLGAVCDMDLGALLVTTYGGVLEAVFSLGADADAADAAAALQMARHLTLAQTYARVLSATSGVLLAAGAALAALAAWLACRASRWAARAAAVAAAAHLVSALTVCISVLGYIHVLRTLLARLGARGASAGAGCGLLAVAAACLAAAAWALTRTPGGTPGQSRQ